MNPTAAKVIGTDTGTDTDTLLVVYLQIPEVLIVLEMPRGQQHRIQCKLIVHENISNPWLSNVCEPSLSLLLTRHIVSLVLEVRILVLMYVRCVLYSPRSRRRADEFVHS
jgi:hypothetical protein